MFNMFPSIRTAIQFGPPLQIVLAEDYQGKGALSLYLVRREIRQKIKDEETHEETHTEIDAYLPTLREELRAEGQIPAAHRILYHGSASKG